MEDEQEISASYTESTPWIVAKFGGTSVACASSWESIARIVTSHRRAGYRVVLVCSAVAQVTDLLEGLADEVERRGDLEAQLHGIYAIHDALAADLGLDGQEVLGPLYRQLEGMVRDDAADGQRPAPARRAAIIAMGELMSTSLGARWLTGRGLSARWVDVRTLLRASGTEFDAQHYGSASCACEPDPALTAALAQSGEEIVITQGFLASDVRGDTVLLGRGGSDTSAAYLAAKLAAAKLEIWTDVPGVFSSDPRHCPKARLIKRMTFAEAQALSSLGAQVLHPRCLEPARAHGIPVRIGWTRYPEASGTEIGDRALGEVGVKTVVSRSNLLLVIIARQPRWQPVGFMAEVATCFQRHGLSIDLIGSSPGEIRATIDLGAFPRSGRRVTALEADLGDIGQVRIERDVACVSVAGSSTRSAVHALGDTLRSLAGPDVYLVCHAADDSHVSFVVARRLADTLVEQLHAALFEHVARSPVFGPSFGDLARSAQMARGRDARSDPRSGSLAS